MGYLFLAIALFAGTAKGYCGKQTSGYVTCYQEAMLTNIVRMVLCVLIGLLFIVGGGDVSYIKPTFEVLAIAALSGSATAVAVVAWLIVVRKGAYMLMDVFPMLGVLVPLLLGKVFFRESIRANQWLGLLVLFGAVLLMCSYSNSIKEKMSVSTLLLLIANGVSSGLTDFSQKLFVKAAGDVPISVFNFYTYIFAALVLVVCYFVFNRIQKEAESDAWEIMIKTLGYIVVMAICLFANSFFKTKAAVYLDSAQLYPLNQGAMLILSSIMSATLFKERLTAKCIMGLVLAFVGLIVINVL